MLQPECCSIQQLYIVFPWLQLLLNIGAAANEFLCQKYRNTSTMFLYISLVCTETEWYRVSLELNQNESFIPLYNTSNRPFSFHVHYIYELQLIDKNSENLKGFITLCNVSLTILIFLAFLDTNRLVSKT